MIEIKNLSFTYDKKEKHAVQDVFFHVEDGEILAVLGQTGSGKTTIVNIISGILKIKKGDIIIDEKNIKKNAIKFAGEIGVAFKDPRFYSRLSAKQNLKFFASLHDKKCEDIEVVLDRVGLLDNSVKKLHTFDKSMIKRLAIARAIISRPSVLILDEPLCGVDEYSKRVIKDVIMEQKNQSTSVLLMTSNGLFAKTSCDRVAFLVDGRIKKITSPIEFDKKGKLIDVSYYYKRQVINHIIDTGKMTDRELLANIVRRNAIRTIHSNENTLNDMLNYLNQEDRIL